MVNMRRSYPQSGRRKSITADRKVKAKISGWRKSKTGKLYFENRRNRSDQVGKRI